MLKRILIALLVALAGISVYTTVYDSDIAESLQMQQALVGIGRTFSISSSSRVTEPEMLWAALEQAADEHNVNVFRATHGYDAEMRPFVSYYILLTSIQTAFYEPFRLRQGRLLTPEETRVASACVSSEGVGGSGPVGTLDDIGRNDQVAVYGLEALFDRYPTAGNYVVEARSPEDAAAFILSLAQNLTQLGVETTPEDLAPKSGFGSASFEPIGTRLFSRSTAWAVAAAIMVLAAYRQLYESKRTAVLLLHGYSILQAWLEVSGRLFLTAASLLVPASLFVSLVVPGATPGMVAGVVLQVASTAMAALAGSLLTVPYIATIHIHEALKNRKDTQALVVFNLVGKAALTVALAVMGLSVVTRYEGLRETEELMGSWQQTSQYTVFHPLYIGMDDDEDLNTVLSPGYAVLYPVLNERGALYVNASQYEAIIFELEEMYPYPDYAPYRSIMVNPNYLAAYPVLDTEGAPVSVSDSETDWVVLVPECYKPEAVALKEYYQLTRSGDETRSSLWDVDRVIFGTEPTEEQLNQKVRIIWVADDQRVFSFDSAVYPDDGNCIVGPIIEVMTVSNSTFIDRSGCFAGMPSTALKVLLTDGSTSQTYQELLPLLQELRLDDNLRRLVTMDDYVFEVTQRYQQGILTLAHQCLLVLVLFMLLAVQSVTLLFEQDARRIASRRLLGYGFISRQRRFLAVFVLSWVAAAATSLAVVRLGDLPFDLPAAVLVALPAILLVLLVMESSVSAAAMFFVESRRVANVLKGEF